MITILTKKLVENATLPTYATPGAAGLDLYAAEDINLLPNYINKIKTGLSVAIPEGYELQVRSRSGMAKDGFFVANSPGTIDSDYRGEICVLIYNSTSFSKIIRAGDRIAQLVPNKVPKVEWKMVATLDETERGAGGFGHTGK